MLDIWNTFPASMGDDQAWITYNHAYADIAKADNRNTHLRIRVGFHKPTEQGLPTNEEFPKLSTLDESLEKIIHNNGGLYVGRITVAGHRYFYYYLEKKEEKIQKDIEQIAKSSNYKLQYLWESDPEKKKYWNELYPTDDDWQVIEDLKVLDALSEKGDNKDKKREVLHWAYFSTKDSASRFKEWAIGKNYKIIHMGPSDDKSEFMVEYSHIGTMNLGDITHHTISSNRKARELNGSYDGWETSVEK